MQSSCVTVRMKLLVYLISLLIHAVVTSDENDQIICKNQFSTFVVGMTGFGGKKTSSVEKVSLQYNYPLLVCYCWVIVATPPYS